MSPDWSLYLGTIYAREGRFQEARLVSEKAERAISDTIASSSVNRDARRDRAVVETLKAEVELAHSKSALVTESLEVALSLWPMRIGNSGIKTRPRENIRSWRRHRV
jgi:hypothetical protein